MHPAFWGRTGFMTSYEVKWYSFWYQWIEEVHTYALGANIRVSDVGGNKPPSEDMLQKIPQEDEG